MEKNTKILTIEKPFGGWVSTINNTSMSTLNYSIEGRADQYAKSTAISLFHFDKLGHISPGEGYTKIADTGNKVNRLPLNGSMSSSNHAFCVLESGTILRVAAGGGVYGVLNNIDPAFAGTSHSGHTITNSNNPDVLVMTDRAGVEYVISTYEDNTDADAMLTYAVTYTVVANAWFSVLASAALKKGVPLKISQGPDGNVYITNGQYVASATTAGTVSLEAATCNAKVLDVGSGWVISGITTYKTYLAMIGYKPQSVYASSGMPRSECRVWLWDTTSSGYNFVYDIPDNYANAIYCDGDNLYAFTNGRNSSSKIFKFNGSAFVLQFESQLLTPSSTPKQGSIDSFQSSVHIASGVGVYQYFNNGFHYRSMVTDGTTPAIAVGMLKNFDYAILFVGVQTGASTYAIYRENGNSTYYTPALFRSRLYELPYGSNISKIVLYFSQFSSGASLNTKLYKDYHTTALLNNTVTYATVGEIDSYSIPTPGARNINSFYLDLLFNHTNVTDTAAIVRKVEVYYDTPERV